MDAVLVLMPQPITGILLERDSPPGNRCVVGFHSLPLIEEKRENMRETRD